VEMKKKKQAVAMAFRLVSVALLIFTPLVPLAPGGGVSVLSDSAVSPVPATPSNAVSSFLAFLLATRDLKVGRVGAIADRAKIGNY
jgi:hypothetical protein